MSTAAFLRNVPVFVTLPDELLERVAAEVREVRFAAGEWILREDEPAENMYVVRGGRVDIVAEGPPPAVIRVLRRGDVLGELALLHAGTRSASARARRDVDLLELRRTAFEALITEAPAFALGLTRAMGAQLAASRSPVATATLPRTIAVVGLDAGAPVPEVADGLRVALMRHGSVAALARADVAAIDRAERDADRVVLSAGTRPEDPWTELCLREADLVIAVTSGSPESAWTAHARALEDCELVVFGDPPVPERLAAFAPRDIQVVADGTARRRALEATARRLAGRSPGIVFSGGGARAFAHLGVLEELHAAGLRFDRVGGVSLGSLIAASVAMDLEPEAVYEVFERSFGANPTNDYGVPAYSLVRGAKTRRMLRDAFGDRRIETLPQRFFCLSCDLIAREAVVHRSGPLAEAVFASLAIPGVFPPVATPDGRLLVDGGVLDNLPVATMARRGEGPVVAVDVTGPVGQFRRPQRSGLERIGRPVRRALTGSDAQIPYIGETIMRTVTVGSIDTVAAARLHADLVITPKVDGVGLMDWKALAHVRELGRQAARDVLATDPDLPSRLAI